MSKLFLTLFVVFLTLGMMPAFGQGIYIGAGIGNTYLDLDLEDVGEEAQTISENSTAYKFFAGYRGQSFFGLEGGYRNFGNIDAKVLDIGVETKTTGWDVEAVGRFEIAIIDIFAKVGALFWKTESVVPDFDFAEEETGTAFMWGLGVGVRISAFGVRLEYEKFQVADVNNLAMLSLSATFGF